MVPILLDRELLERLDGASKKKSCRVVYPRVLVCVSAHESMLYLSYSFVALVKVIFLCGGIRRC